MMRDTFAMGRNRSCSFAGESPPPPPTYPALLPYKAAAAAPDSLSDGGLPIGLRRWPFLLLMSSAQTAASTLVAGWLLVSSLLSCRREGESQRVLLGEILVGLDVLLKFGRGSKLLGEMRVGGRY
jgi:hypothetical protein